MTLKQSNPHLKSAAKRKAALRVSAQTSSAVDGIRAPFGKGRQTAEPTSTEEFIAHWKRRGYSSIGPLCSGRKRSSLSSTTSRRGSR